MACEKKQIFSNMFERHLKTKQSVLDIIIGTE